MNEEYKVIVKLKIRGISNREISRSLGLSRNTVNRVVSTMNMSGYTLEELAVMPNSELCTLFKRKRDASIMHQKPNYSELTKELSKPGVTMKLLWEEYADVCRLTKKVPYSLTQFRKYFNEHLAANEFTDIIKHRPAERTEVDWSGQRPTWIDPVTGEVISGYLFVGVLPHSQYGFALATPSMAQEHWIDAHIRMFEYFGGVTTSLVPDNLKTGITRNNKDGIVVNPTYNDMAEHYGTVVIPTRVRKPKDKASVEGAVKVLTQNIIARLRNYQFFSIDEYNEQLLVQLDKFNRQPFQKKQGSRFELFESEKQYLQPLPPNRYEIVEWKEAKVQSNSHIAFRKRYYSVPHSYIGERVKLKVTKTMVRVYSGVTLLCEHKISVNSREYYVTDPTHMPLGSNAAGDWNSARYLNWAKQKGPFIFEVVKRRFESARIEQQQYKTVHSIIKLADKYSNERLEYACMLALEHIECPNYHHVKGILANNQDLIERDKEQKKKKISDSTSQFLRGANYYDE